MCSLRGHNGDGGDGDGGGKKQQTINTVIRGSLKRLFWRFGGYGVASMLLHV